VALSDRRMVFQAALAAVLISAVGLSACGRKGALEPPPSAKVTPPPAAADGTTQDQAKPANNKPDRPFALDFLIK
jgi:predicted small lipoprotein YifL